MLNLRRELILFGLLLLISVPVTATPSVPIRTAYSNEWGGFYSSHTKIDNIIANVTYMHADAWNMVVVSNYIEALQGNSKPGGGSWWDNTTWCPDCLGYAINASHNAGVKLFVRMSVNKPRSSERAERVRFNTTYAAIIRSNNTSYTADINNNDLAFSQLSAYERNLILYIATHYAVDGIELEEPYYNYDQSYSQPIRNMVNTSCGFDPYSIPRNTLHNNSETNCMNIQMANAEIAFFIALKADLANVTPVNQNFTLTANGGKAYSPWTGFDPAVVSNYLDYYSAQIYEKNLTSGTTSWQNSVGIFRTNLPAPKKIVAIAAGSWDLISPALNANFSAQVATGIQYGADGVGMFTLANDSTDINISMMDQVHNIPQEAQNSSVVSWMNVTRTPHAWNNLTIYAWNNSGTGKLSAPLIVNTQIQNNPIAISNISSTYILNEGEILYIHADYTDPDNDTGTFSDNASQWAIDPSTGIASWATSFIDAGVYSWQIQVADGYGSASTKVFTVTVTDVAQTYIPGIPTLNSVVIGNFWVNTTWNAGAGNTTNSYNISVNGVWTNGSM